MTHEIGRECAQAPKPYKVRPERFNAYTTSRAVTVLLQDHQYLLDWKKRIVNIPFGVLSISDRVTDDVFEEDLEDTTSFFVDEATDTLHSTTTGETTDSRLGDT